MLKGNKGGSGLAGFLRLFIQTAKELLHGKFVNGQEPDQTFHGHIGLTFL